MIKKFAMGGVVALASFASPANAGWFGPSTYEECVFDKMKTSKNNDMTRLAESICRSDFPCPNQLVDDGGTCITKEDAAERQRERQRGGDAVYKKLDDYLLCSFNNPNAFCKY